MTTDILTHFYWDTLYIALRVNAHHLVVIEQCQVVFFITDGAWLGNQVVAVVVMTTILVVVASATCCRLPWRLITNIVT